MVTVLGARFARSYDASAWARCVVGRPPVCSPSPAVGWATRPRWPTFHLRYLRPQKAPTDIRHVKSHRLERLKHAGSNFSKSGWGVHHMHRSRSIDRSYRISVQFSQPFLAVYLLKKIVFVCVQCAVQACNSYVQLYTVNEVERNKTVNVAATSSWRDHRKSKFGLRHAIKLIELYGVTKSEFCFSIAWLRTSGRNVRDLDPGRVNCQSRASKPRARDA
jgi:hypothetical protein